MRLLFLILAHDQPDQVLELAQSLVGAARDGIALIHFDARSAPGAFEVLRAAAAAEPRIRLVEKRVACRWGSFGLVEAPLNALTQIEAEGIEPDYVILLSGTCLPCRPVTQLERYLAENAGREFIEVEDEAWVGNGWRSERWRYRFWFDHKTQHPAEWLFFQLQRILGLERRFPKGLIPRFGSQWWALTWDTCRAMLMDIRRAPGRLRFFRSVWIPDEMVFQTYVHALVHPDEIAGFGLTHFQFSNRGKPIVFHDDHIDYVRTLDRFFVRKVAPQAARLRAALLAIAGAADDGAALDPIGVRRNDYALKVAAQTHYPVPGQVFYRDQHVDMIDTVLARAEAPYVVLRGPPAQTRALAAPQPEQHFTLFGEVFHPAEVDLGEGRAELGGLRRQDVAIRNLHPALFLTRLRARSVGVPVLRWSPLDHPRLLDGVLRDRWGLVVACLPFTDDDTRDRKLLALTSFRDPGRLPNGPALPGIDHALASQAKFDHWVNGLGTALDGGWLDWLGWALFYAPEGENRVLRRSTIVLPWGLRKAERLRRAGIVMPQAIRRNGRGDGLAELRRSHFAASVAGCSFASFDWFESLETGLEACWKQQLAGDVIPLFGPRAGTVAAAIRHVVDPEAGAPDAAWPASRSKISRGLSDPRRVQ